MDTNNGSVVVTDAPVVLDPNREATAADAAALGRIYKRLAKAEKDHRTAVADLRKALAVWSADADVTDEELAVEKTSAILTGELISCRRLIADLPKGVTAKGGASRQTVVLQFYGAVNRELGKRLSVGDARKINSASFGD